MRQRTGESNLSEKYAIFALSGGHRKEGITLMLSSSLRNTLPKFAVLFRQRNVVQALEIAQKSAHFKSLVMLALALALVGLSYVYGLNWGMDRRFAGPLDTRAQQIASAISDVAYN